MVSDISFSNFRYHKFFSFIILVKTVYYTLTETLCYLYIDTSLYKSVASRFGGNLVNILRSIRLIFETRGEY